MAAALGSKLICNPLLSSVCKWMINACFYSVLDTSSLYSTKILKHCPSADVPFNSAALGVGFHVPWGLNKYDFSISINSPAWASCTDKDFSRWIPLYTIVYNGYKQRQHLCSVSDKPKTLIGSRLGVLQLDV